MIDLGALRQMPPAPAQYDPLVVAVGGEDLRPEIDPKTGALVLDHGDGSVTIDFEPGKKQTKPGTGKFDENLADTLEADSLKTLAEELLVEIESDEQSRQGWIDIRSKGLELLALKIEEARGDAGTSSAPLEGMSTVRSSVLLEACIRFQANARGELLPADGPVKVLDISDDPSLERDELASDLQRDFNTYLTQFAPEYYPDTDRMLFEIGFGGCGFKKVYHCPIRMRPVSESVDPDDLIVNAGATDFQNAQRITHKIMMPSAMLKRMMQAGAYRDVPLTDPVEDFDQLREEKADISGVAARSDLPQDQQHTIYETLCYRDIGEDSDGIPCPYKVVIDKTSRNVLEVRRFWREGDKQRRRRPLYVRFPYIDAMTIYGLGLLHIVGNTTKALTAAMREILDAGMFASFPGFLYGESTSRQETNNFRIPPGGGMKIQTGGMPIGQAVMALPYKEPSAALLAFCQHLEEAAQRLSGTAEMQVGEGHQNAPVGTTLALIEQQTKVLASVHKRLHAAQSEEFRILKELFLEDPEAFWRDNPNYVNKWTRERFVEALETCDLVPVADPNNPTQTHRLLKAMAIKQLQAANPMMYDARAVDTHILRMIGISNPEELFNQNPMPPPNPMVELKNAELQQKQQDMQVRATIEAAKIKQKQQQVQADSAVDMAHLQVEKQRIGADMAIQASEGMHGEAVRQHEEQLRALAPLQRPVG